MLFHHLPTAEYLLEGDVEVKTLTDRVLAIARAVTPPPQSDPWVLTVEYVALAFKTAPISPT